MTIPARCPRHDVSRTGGERRLAVGSGEKAGGDAIGRLRFPHGPGRRKNGDATTKTAWYAVTLGAALLLSASTVAVNAAGGGSCHLRKTCAVDLDALCAGVTPGEGRVRACLMAHMASMSTFCSAKLSREIYLATECEADVKHFCGDVISGGARIASCVQTHFGEVSDSCKSALASIEAPGNNP
ncbi:MAG TPA: hypothetical protein VKA12_07485 [Roseiarcus sp.]|nr:hypothetical protein [Roseiarcus sp.]